MVTVKPVPVASHALPPQPARPTATATAAPVKKVAPPAVAPTLPKVNIPAAEKGRWRCDWHGLAVNINSCNWQSLTISINSYNWQSLAALTAVTGRGWRLAVMEFCPMAEYSLKTVYCYFSCGTSNCDKDTQCE